MGDLQRDVASWSRWLHIYLSMISFGALLFFAVTGITLNHTNWIEGQQKSQQVTGKLPSEYFNQDKVNELMIVEKLRTEHRISAPLTSFITDDSECSISFKGPGYAADGFVDRETGDYSMTITRSGVWAVMNDLHKGRDSGKTWSLFIDISAVLMILVSLTGFLMLLYLKKKRMSGLLVTLIGFAAVILLYVIFV